MPETRERRTDTMTPFHRIAFGAAALLMLTSVPAHAAWNNVFEATCWCHHRQPTSSFAAPAVHFPPVTSFSNPCCNPCCHTSYVQRCYYQPVTTYKTECVPVTSYRTSYYFEPVCSYRTSCYYDPCTCRSIQVTIPVTSYRLRSQCNAVTSYVQRCVPVTTYRPTFYLEAVTTCAQPACPPPCDPAGTHLNGTGVAPPGDGTRIPSTTVPNVDESNSGFGPPGTGTFRRVDPPDTKRYMPPAPMKLDHVVSRPTNGAAVSGQVVANNFVTPLRGAQLVFVSKQGTRELVTADRKGQFNVTLANGDWSIYMSHPDGSVNFHSSIEITENRSRQFMVVSR